MNTITQEEINDFIKDAQPEPKKKFIAHYVMGGKTFKIPVNSLSEALPTAVLPAKMEEEFESSHNGYDEYAFNLETANDLLQLL